ncbi:bifunctional adenosylcobinamide kinase/adenosylcobinamide-phosphate guanylyltransferase [Anaerocolumna xylanovorans]|uniref:Adenosylcobinamide kinase /adenosylcobinamide-phosphate guanylyltransferase n=1 Tax=Anaerocolumna xylanovorans DSM 12503 TaxID=1121345 RepID=A0A1M7XYP2_9FIRM|nr:bifunctional adenosylcobinamide kinase/adenosylcobinamide-phosphate guanylyltransferase [Anaerocolumna xylanovorans]SHO44194.1 adenosylcobinamide kinase /adenosylcobinamide-phosphate guanylyltransferase [Anaerocolumna xylanovorans DSM 12503]
MELYIGGYAQGKLNYVLKQTGIPMDKVIDALVLAERGISEEIGIVNHFHLFVRNCLREGKSPEDLVEAIIAGNPQLIIISDEVGNGIVPMEAEEREYRERLGRILCGLAEKALKVERIICGIGQRIK